MLTPLFLMTDPMQDSTGTDNSNPTMDKAPGMGVLPNNLGWQQTNNATNTMDSEGFTTVGKQPTISDILSSKTTRIGVQISRVNSSNKPYHVEDLQNCFDFIRQVDPAAVVLNHMNDTRSAKMIADLAGPKMTSMDYNGFCHIQTMPWGSPKEGCFKTTFTFWIGSNTITDNLKKLRNDSNFKQCHRSRCSPLMSSWVLRDQQSFWQSECHSYG